MTSALSPTKTCLNGEFPTQRRAQFSMERTCTTTNRNDILEATRRQHRCLGLQMFKCARSLVRLENQETPEGRQRPAHKWLQTSTRFMQQHANISARRVRSDIRFEVRVCGALTLRLQLNFFCSARLQFELPHAEDPVAQAEGTTDHDDENDEIVRVTASAGDFVSCDITTHKSVTERYFSFCGRRVTL